MKCEDPKEVAREMREVAKDLIQRVYDDPFYLDKERMIDRKLSKILRVYADHLDPPLDDRVTVAGIEVEGDKATVTLHSTRESVLTEWAHKRMDEGAPILRAKVDGTRLTITQSEGGNDD